MLCELIYTKLSIKHNKVQPIFLIILYNSSWQSDNTNIYDNIFIVTLYKEIV